MVSCRVRHAHLTGNKRKIKEYPKNQNKYKANRLREPTPKPHTNKAALTPISSANLTLTSNPDSTHNSPASPQPKSPISKLNALFPNPKLPHKLYLQTARQQCVPTNAKSPIQNPLNREGGKISNYQKPSPESIANRSQFRSDFPTKTPAATA